MAHAKPLQMQKQNSLSNHHHHHHHHHFNLQVPIISTAISKFDPYEHLNIQLNPDGSITRHLNLPTATITNPNDPSLPVLSKDITLDPSKDTSLRLYFPAKLCFQHPSQTRLPIVVYFHDCYWVQNRANHFSLHLSRSYAACTVPAIIVLVDYRMAPENRLPAQYEDAVDALLWLKKQALDPDGEPWLRDHGDFSRCFLEGSGSGANVVFNAALRGLDVDLTPLKISGLIMNQPLFGGKNRTESEIQYATDQLMPLPALDVIWEMALPKGTDRDHRFCNPMVGGPHKEKVGGLQRCLIFGFGMDPLIDRQQEFVKMLVKHGVQVQAQFDDVGFHRIELVDSRRATTINTMVKEFIHDQYSVDK